MMYAYGGPALKLPAAHAVAGDVAEKYNLKQQHHEMRSAE